jgi:hypothetical protein
MGSAMDLSLRFARHVANKKTTEDEGIREQEDPHHGLAPRHAKDLFVPRPILYKTLRSWSFFCSAIQYCF